MDKGRIKWFNPNKYYGFIDVEGQKVDLFFHGSEWKVKTKKYPQENDLVTFDIGKGPKGNRAENVRLVESPREESPDSTSRRPKQKKSSPQRTSGDKYRFLNPYNFVRPINKLRPNNNELGNCCPPPHDRYLGLTGRITARVSTKTPLFISDGHAIKGTEHCRYRFFEYDDKPALPASSLRGMIRAAFEAVTNACFEILDNKRLSYHYDTGKTPWLVPARVEQDENKEWKLRLLTGTTDLQIIPSSYQQYKRGPSGRQYAAWLHRYWPLKPSGTLLKQPQNNRTRSFKVSRFKGTEIDLQNIDHGEGCYAIIEQRTHAHPKIKFWDVVTLGRNREDLTQLVERDQKVVYGWPCLNNQNIEPKHSERFFFETAKPSKLLKLKKPIIDAYEALIQDYQDRHKDRVAKRKEPGKPVIARDKKEAGFSRFIYQKQARKLKHGDLVYAMINGTVDNPRIEFIVPVSVPRVGHDDSIGQLLDDQFHHCTDYNTLCPACRTFGWVHPKPDEGEKKYTAYAGRIRLSHAMPVEGKVQQRNNEVTLAILGSPKPTQTNFYLLNKQGNPDPNVEYNKETAQLRGRKFYRHHGDEPSKHRNGDEYERVTDGQNNGKDEFNRTVRGLVEPNSQFEFTLEFENLAPLELGALLWSLELEPDMYHRLGYAKPLGFGSAKLVINQLERVDWSKRLESLDGAAGWEDISRKKDELILNFKQAMEDYYRDEFSRLREELESILSQHPNELPVHYPRKDDVPTAEGKNFEWFGDNQTQPLDLAANDKGLTFR